MSMYIAGGMAVASVAASLYSSNQAGKSAAKAGSAASKAENEAVIRSNMQSVVRNNYKAGMMNMQAGLRKKQSVQQGHDITAQATAVTGAATANQAASGNIGASVDAVLTDIEMKGGEARAQLLENYEADQTNFNNELEALSMSAGGEVQRAKNYEYNGPSSGAMWGQALLAGASTYMSVYGGKKMSLNLGDASNVTKSVRTPSVAGDWS